ncbi:MAG: SNF2-related protein, partial [Phycisphaerales bacterium]|nr:SNF2-related protein [Phycisphaerales bacterium]
MVATAGWHRFSSAGRVLSRARKSNRSLKKANKRLRNEQQVLHRQLRESARSYRQSKLDQKLRETPISSLKSPDTRGVRWGNLERGGIRSVADLINRNERQLDHIQGVGSHSIYLAKHAARLFQDELELMQVSAPSLDELDNPSGADFFRHAYRSLQGKEQLNSAEVFLDHAVSRSGDALKEIRRSTSFGNWLLRRSTTERLEIAEARCEGLEYLFEEARNMGYHKIERRPSRIKVQQDVLRDDVDLKYAQYAAIMTNALDGEVSSSSLPRLAVQGGLPEEIVSRIEAHPLETQGLGLTLRTYQAFGARFILEQKRTLLGDEMGLGKTIQVLAAMTHIENTKSKSIFIVACPASLIPNWSREIRDHTNLRQHLLHGMDRQESVKQWLETGGVGITSYATLFRLNLDRQLDTRQLQIDLLAVDEAHYVKNRTSQRSKAVSGLAHVSQNICLMTGTPLENEVEDFINLIDIVTPHLADDLRMAPAGSPRLPQLAAPAYLRRNQEDVLTELPERIEVTEHIELSTSDRSAYESAVMEGNYMAMRQATNVGRGDGTSAKFQRIMELLEDYRAQGRKVLIFSFFLETLFQLENAIKPVGVVHGGINTDERMKMMD